MAEQKSNYEKLQECSRLISKLIELEKLYRESKVTVNDVKIQIPEETLKHLKAEFIEARHRILINLNTIED